jgi:hypothetical protein
VNVTPPPASSTPPTPSPTAPSAPSTPPTQTPVVPDANSLTCASPAPGPNYTCQNGSWVIR